MVAKTGEERQWKNCDKIKIIITIIMVIFTYYMGGRSTTFERLVFNISINKTTQWPLSSLCMY